MKIYFTFLVHFIFLLPTLEAFSSDGNDTISAICHGSQFAADPYDCNKYFQCSNGEPILKNCPEGLVWDPNSNSCSYPWPIGNVNCTEKTNPDPDDPMEPISGEQNHIYDIHYGNDVTGKDPLEKPLGKAPTAYFAMKGPVKSFKRSIQVECPNRSYKDPSWSF